MSPIAPEMETGMVAIDDFAPSSEVAPFGGVKAAGYGLARARRWAQSIVAAPIAIIGSASHWPMERFSASRPRKTSGPRVNSTRKRRIP